LLRNNSEETNQIQSAALQEKPREKWQKLSCIRNSTQNKKKRIPQFDKHPEKRECRLTFFFFGLRHFLVNLPILVMTHVARGSSWPFAIACSSPAAHARAHTHNKD